MQCIRRFGFRRVPPEFGSVLATMAGNKKDTTTTISQIPWLEANYKHVNDKVSRIRFIAILQTGDLHGYFNDEELGDESKFREGLKVKDSKCMRYALHYNVGVCYVTEF
eukprot:185150_1